MSFGLTDLSPQGLEETYLLLFRRCLYQLQLPRDRPVQDLQDEDLDVSH